MGGKGRRGVILWRWAELRGLKLIGGGLGLIGEVFFFLVHDNLNNKL